MYTTRQVFLESDSIKTEITYIIASENIERRKNLEPEICNTNRLDVITKKLEKWLLKGNLISKTGFKSHLISLVKIYLFV